MAKNLKVFIETLDKEATEKTYQELSSDDKTVIDEASAILQSLSTSSGRQNAIGPTTAHEIWAKVGRLINRTQPKARR